MDPYKVIELKKSHIIEDVKRGNVKAALRGLRDLEDYAGSDTSYRDSWDWSRV